jgi:ubiquinone/menaquinone biosynthesis C-methylase UbiE
MRNEVKHPFRIRIDRYVKKAVTSFLSHTNSGVVLDLGCGNAPYAYLFKNFYYVGGDLDRRSRKVSVLCDSHFLPFRSEAFDLILATEILEHVSKPSFVLKECGRVLKFGGHIILTTRFMFPYHPEPTDYYRFTKESLTQLFEESGFTILRLIEEEGIIISNGKYFFLL